MNDEQYPTRSPFFAHRFCRLLAKACIAQEIGPEACWLLTTIALLEDAKRYSAPVTFYNEPLMAACGFGSRKRLVAARGKAMRAGWLHYEQASKGVAGRYWVTIPEAFSSINEAPYNEDDSSICRSDTEHQRGAKRNTKGAQLSICRSDTEHQRGAFLTYPKNLSQEPIPKERELATASVPAALRELISQWNGLGPSIVKAGNGARGDPPSKVLSKAWGRLGRDPELRDAFADLPRLMVAIHKSTFCHLQGWFSLPWLFGKNKNGELNAVRLLAGCFEDGTLGQKSAMPSRDDNSAWAKKERSRLFHEMYRKPQ